MSSTDSSKQSKSVSLFWQVGVGVGLILSIISLIGPLVCWPLLDESTYVLQARQIAEGLLPYRDFYDFVTPGSQLIGSLLIQLNGFSMLSLRLVIIVGWLLQLLMLARMGKDHLPKTWLGLFLVFLWLTDSRYPIFQHHFWSGLTALSSVWMAWQYLQSLYNGKAKPWQLSLSGVLCALTFWTTQSLGFLLTAAFFFYSFLHCFLHEREEKGVSYRQIDNKAVWLRWVKLWGQYWLLPGLAIHALCVGWLFILGIWPDFVRDTFQWLAGGHYNQTSILGYFTTFHQEFADTIRPFLDGVPFPAAWLFIFRFPIALHLFLIGLLPVIGILGMGYTLPNRFHYRLLQRQDDELLLFWVTATAMMLSTMSYSTSMHITSNGGLAFLLGFIVIYRMMAHKSRATKIFQVSCGLFCILLLLGAVVGTLTTLTLSSWINPSRAWPETLAYVDANTNSKQLAQLINRLREAETLNRPIFVFSETPALYLTGHYRNATRFTLIIPQYTSTTQLAEIMSDLEKRQPLFIVDDQTMAFLPKDDRFSHYSPQELTLPQIQAFIQARYKLDGQYGRYLLFRHQ